MSGLRSFSLSCIFRDKSNSRSILSVDEKLPSTSSNERKKRENTTRKVEFPTTHIDNPAFDETNMECPLCILKLPLAFFPRLENCHHKSCFKCLQEYLRIEITESRVNLSCPQCSKSIHPNDIRMILKDEKLYRKYESFMLRRVLATEPDARWCPAPDCDYVVIAKNGARNPMLTCERPGCGIKFCYNCRNVWKSGHSCSTRRGVRPAFMQQDLSIPNDENMKPCPSCRAPISKMNDGSCNHMKCSICGTQFCWLCMKEITEFHYFGPTGCTLWGKKPWSRTKKILWQLGLMISAPAVIALMAGVAIPSIVIATPVLVGRSLYAKYNRPSVNKHRRNLIVSGGVLASTMVSPLLAGCAVCVAVPALLVGIYVVLPMSYCCTIDLDEIDRELDRLENRREIERQTKN